MTRLRHPSGRAALLAGLLAPLAAVLAVAAPPEPTSKQLFVQGINDNPAWMVRVDVDHKDRVYRIGETLSVKVRSEREGYLYLFNVSVNNEVTLLFPNKHQSDNKIGANQEVMVPDPQRPAFAIGVGNPTGKELVKAIVTTEPLKEINLDDFKKAAAPTYLPVSKGSAKRLQFELLGDPSAATQGTVQEQKDKVRQEKPEQYVRKTREWAEHEVEIVTVGKGEPDPNQGPNGKARPPQRVGVFIGVSDYQDPNIRGLTCSHKDAEAMAKTMKATCGLDQALVLTNKNATFRAIQKAICEDAYQATRPGDTIILYWSGHGGRCANTNSTEADGYDEYLVPYDGKLGEADAIKASMVLDDTFGRWVQELDGRRVVVILDTCHSGGQIEGAAKSVARPDVSKAILRAGKAVTTKNATTKNDAANWKKKHFLDTEMVRAKDIGHKEAIVLASSTARQLSFERRDGDMSVMTYYLIEALNNARGPLTLEQVFSYVQGKVPEYVQAEFPGTTQTPLLAPEAINPALVIRP